MHSATRSCAHALVLLTVFCWREMKQNVLNERLSERTSKWLITRVPVSDCFECTRVLLFFVDDCCLSYFCSFFSLRKQRIFHHSLNNNSLNNKKPHFNSAIRLKLFASDKNLYTLSCARADANGIKCCRCCGCCRCFGCCR